MQFATSLRTGRNRAKLRHSGPRTGTVNHCPLDFFPRPDSLFPCMWRTGALFIPLCLSMRLVYQPTIYSIDIQSVLSQAFGRFVHVWQKQKIRTKISDWLPLCGRLASRTRWKSKFKLSLAIQQAHCEPTVIGSTLPGLECCVASLWTSHTLALNSLIGPSLSQVQSHQPYKVSLMKCRF